MTRNYLSFPEAMVLLLFLVLPSALWSQDPLLRDLTQEPSASCPEVQDSLLPRIQQSAFQDLNRLIPRVLPYWERACGRSEAILRTELLWTIQSGGKLPEAQVLLPYFQAYLEERNFWNYYPNDPQVATWKKYGDYTAHWASWLRSSDSLPGDSTQALTLALLSYPLERPLEHWLWKSASRGHSPKIIQALRDSVEAQRIGMTYWEFSFFQPGYSGKLKSRLGARPGLQAALGIRSGKRSHIQFYLGLAGIEMQEDLRINQLDSNYRGKGNLLLRAGAQMYYRLWQGRWNAGYLLGGLGYAGLDTGVERANRSPDEPESEVMIGSADISLGLEWNILQHGRRKWGLRGIYHLMDFNQGIRALSDLRGNMWEIGLSYRF